MDDNHDHSMPTHTMNCPVCQVPIYAHAHDDDMAVQGLMMAGKAHFEEAGHPQDQAMSPEEMEATTRRDMKRMGQ